MSGGDQRRGARSAEANDRSKDRADRDQRHKREQLKEDTQRKAEWLKAEERRVAEVRRRDNSKRTEQRRDASRKESQRHSQNVKAAADKDRARKQGEAIKKAEAVEADKKQALAADVRRRALAAVVERQNHQKAQQQDAHRRQTDQMRTLHRAETQSHKDNEAVAVERHAQDIRRIDNTEREALDALSVQRGSLVGRSVAFIKGKAHYDRKADAITERCEATRMSKHRELEALKERQFSAAQQARLRQAHERKGMFEFHRLDRQQLAQAHDRGREAQVSAHERAFVRAARREERGPSRKRSR